MKIPTRTKRATASYLISNSSITTVSAYQVWLDQGNSGTEQQFLNSLKGTNGLNGTNGTDGIDGAAGPQGPVGPQGPAGIAALVQDNVDTITGSVTNIGREWKIIKLVKAPAQGTIVRINILTNNSLATKYDAYIADTDNSNDISTLLKYEDVPAKNYRLDSGESIPYNSSLYLAIRFNDGTENTIDYKLDIRTQGEISITTTTSNYRTIPPLAASMKLASYMPLAHDLGSQVDGNNSSFVLNPPAVIDSIMLMENGLVLRQDTGTETGDYSITNDSLITMNYSPLLGNSLVAMYIEK